MSNAASTTHANNNKDTKTPSPPATSTTAKAEAPKTDTASTAGTAAAGTAVASTPVTDADAEEGKSRTARQVILVHTKTAEVTFFKNKKDAAKFLNGKDVNPTDYRLFLGNEIQTTKKIAF